MLASVSPASYRAIINGQSDWGIFPLLLDFSIIKDLGATRSSRALRLSARHGMKSVQGGHDPKFLEPQRMIMGTAIEAGIPPMP